MVRPSAWVRRQIAPIALDLGRRFIRALQLSRQNGRTVLGACGQREVPVTVDSAERYQEAAAELVPAILDAEGFLGRDVITALPWEDVRAHSLRLPLMSDEATATAVRAEAVRLFRIDPDQIEMRFMSTGVVSDEAGCQQNLLVLACNRTVITRHVQFLAELDLNPVGLDPAPCALFRSFERFLRREQDATKVNAFIDVGYEGTRIVLTRGRDPVWVHSIPIGGRRFDHLVAQHLDLSLRQAAEIRIRLHRRIGMDRDRRFESGDEHVQDATRWAILNALRPALDELSDEIDAVFDHWTETLHGPRPLVVTVVGGEAYNRDVLQRLSDLLGLPVECGRPVRSVSMGNHPAGHDRRAGHPDWATVLGLALKPVGALAEVPS